MKKMVKVKKASAMKKPGHAYLGDQADNFDKGHAMRERIPAAQISGGPNYADKGEPSENGNQTTRAKNKMGYK